MKKEMNRVMISTNIMDEMQYEGFSHIARLVWFSVALHDETQMSGLMQYDFFGIAKRLGFTKKEEPLLASALDELRNAGWLWIDGDWMFVPKMQDSFDALREYKQKSHIKRMLEWVGSQSNIAIDKWRYTYINIIGLLKSDSDFEKYEQNTLENPHENAETRTENTISEREQQFPNETLETRTENAVSEREQQFPNETLETRTENEQSERNASLKQRGSLSFLSFSKKEESVVPELGERGVGKTENGKTVLTDDPDVSSVLAQCVARGVPQSFAEACIAQAESVSWTDATGRAITKRVAYVESAWARQSMGSRKIERSVPVKGQKRNGHEITSVAGDPIKGLAIVGGA